VKGYAKLRNHIVEEEYDVVQANAGDTLRYMVLSTLMMKKRPVLIFRNANKISDFLISDFKKGVFKWLVKRVDGVASVSKNCLDDIRKTLHVKESNSVYLPISIDTNYESSLEGLQEAGIEPRKFNFLHVGSFVREKNHRGLLEIFASLKKHFPDAQLLLAGSGPLVNEIRNIVDKRGFKKDVLFLGQRKDIRDIMPHCTMLLLPSLIEGLPGVILEAMHARLPVAAYNVGGIGEVVKHNVTGILAEPGNSEDFVQEVLIYLENEKSFIRENAFLKVKEHFGEALIGKGFEKLYIQQYSLRTG
jgi:glycosyltransferase involved in cell wall biosynthesis